METTHRRKAPAFRFAALNDLPPDELMEFHRRVAVLVTAMGYTLDEAREAAFLQLVPITNGRRR